MSVHPVLLEEDSPFTGEACALCKEPFHPGDEIAICPEDATRHHVHCWQANGNRCTAYGCTGHGLVVDVVPPARSGRTRQGRPAGAGRVARAVYGAGTSQAGEGRSKVRVMPARSFSCAQSCLLLVVAGAILLMAFGCFGLWAIADYLMTEVFNLQYRAPSGLVPWSNMPALASALILALRTL